MARRRGFSGRQGRSVVRRLTSWEGGPEGILSPASSAVSGFPTTLNILTDGFTLIRTRGELLLALLTTSVAQGGFQWGLGLTVVSTKAAGVGATAIPGPLTELNWDGWFVHHQGTLKAVTTTLGNDLGATVVRVPIDSKAMRKTKEDDSVVAMLETIEVGTSTLHAELRTRLLFKLP